MLPPRLNLRAGNYPCRVSNETPTTESGAGDRLVRIGAITFFAGAIATLVTVAPLFLKTEPFPSVAYAVCMLMGVGFVIAAAGVLQSIAVQRHQAKAVSASPAGATPAASAASAAQ
ncbi:hypothetical protein [Streptomyces sp. NPDC048442]|uniref:hypothetical protein n=1 Tax=Streptomyces sp. NPDC048442 TaxID=3154823 RepID=UPI00341E8C05